MVTPAPGDEQDVDTERQMAEYTERVMVWARIRSMEKELGITEPYPG